MSDAKIPPLKEPVLTPSGFLSRIWSMFFQDLLDNINAKITHPSTSVVSNVVEFNSTDGLQIKDGGLTHANVADAITKKHVQQHAITSTSDHTSTAAEGKMLKADSHGLPVEGTNTDADVASAVSLKHARSHAVDATDDHTIGGLTSGYIIKSDGTKLAPGTNTDAQVVSAVMAIRGLREGLKITVKDADELYISGGVVEIVGVVYKLEEQLEIPLGIITADTLYYIYVEAPDSGLVLTAGDFSVSTTVPLFSDSLGADYMTGDSTKRYIGRYVEVTE